MIIDTAKIIGSLFYKPHSKAQLLLMVGALVDDKVLSRATLDALYAHDETQLTHDFSLLFEGLGDMPVPPWGSVYLDRERVVFGASTLEYRQFLQEQALSLDSGLREPEDQFGLMLLAYAYLLENNVPSAAAELMENHFLPWAFNYLALMQSQSLNTYYAALAFDVSHWLEQLSASEQWQIAERRIYCDA